VTDPRHNVPQRAATHKPFIDIGTGWDGTLWGLDSDGVPQQLMGGAVFKAVPMDRQQPGRSSQCGV
jgi:hypothetical protein